MITLEKLAGLKSNQGGVTDAFLHVDIIEGEHLYIYMHKGFDHYSKTGCKKCLKLREILYGICQSPRSFWKYLTKKLDACGLNQSEF